MKQQCTGGGAPAEELGEENRLLVVLPEEVMEMIIVKWPFPFLLQARVLSKSWNNKFFGLFKDLTPFRMKVKSVLSNKWPTYSPAFFGREGIRGFDRGTSQWKSLSSRFGAYATLWGASGSYSFLGSVAITLANWNWDRDRAIYVTNVMTGSSRQLHLQLQEKNRPLIAKIFPGNSSRYTVLGDSDSFRVLLLYEIWNDGLKRQEMQATLYDSSLNGWSVPVSTNLVLEGNCFLIFHDTVYLHGKLYFLCKGIRDLGNVTIGLLIHHVNSHKTWKDHVLIGYPQGNIISGGILENIVAGGIFLCGEKFMVALICIIGMHDAPVRIYELDLDVLRLVKVAETGAHFAVDGYKLIRFASDDHFIYCSHPKRGTPVMRYDVHSGEWGSLPPAFFQDLSLHFASSEIMLSSAFTFPMQATRFAALDRA